MIHTFDICLASNKPTQLRTFLEHHGKHEGVKFWVIVDDEECHAIAKEFDAISIQNPRMDLGYYGLHHGYQEAFQQSTGEFFTVVTDEIRYPDGWYERLQGEFERYLTTYPDRIFRLRLSDFRHRNYLDLMQCMVEPENYSIFTRQWLEVSEGLGDFWGPDSWHQCIEYFMMVIKDRFFPKGLYRSFALEFFPVKGMVAGAGWEGAAKDERDNKISEGWYYYTKPEFQRKMLILSYKLKMQVFSQIYRTPVVLEWADNGDSINVTIGDRVLGTLITRVPDIHTRAYQGFRMVGEAIFSERVLKDKLFCG